MSRCKLCTRMVSGVTLHCRFAALEHYTGAAASRAPQDHRLAGDGRCEVAYVIVVTHRRAVECAKEVLMTWLADHPKLHIKSFAVQIAAARGAWGLVANNSRMLQLNDGLKLAVALECQRNSASVDRRNKRNASCADTALTLT